MTNNKPVNRFDPEMPCHKNGSIETRMFNENSSRVISVATYWYDTDFIPRKFDFDIWKS